TILLFLATSYDSLSQDTKKLNEADKLFQVRNYEGALPLYISVFESGSTTPDLLYKIGKCYKESDNINARVRSIKFFEKADESGLDPLPFQFYKDMGDAYFDDEQIEKAINAYSKQ